MIPVLYAANATDFSSFGHGALTDTISCEITEERNGVFECLLKYPVSGELPQFVRTVQKHPYVGNI